MNAERPTIPVTFTIDVDPVAWSEEYGVLLDRRTIQADVRSYIATALNALPVSIRVRPPRATRRVS